MAAPRKYPLELRKRAVRMYRTSEPRPVIKRMAAELGVRPEALRGWIRQAEADHGERDDRLTDHRRTGGTRGSAQGVLPAQAVERDPRGRLGFFAQELDMTRRRY
nr:transposase [Streptomyces sp. NBC_00830]